MLNNIPWFLFQDITCHVVSLFRRLLMNKRNRSFTRKNFRRCDVPHPLPCCHTPCAPGFISQPSSFSLKFLQGCLLIFQRHILFIKGCLIISSGGSSLLQGCLFFLHKCCDFLENHSSQLKHLNACQPDPLFLHCIWVLALHLGFLPGIWGDNNFLPISPLSSLHLPLTSSHTRLPCHIVVSYICLMTRMNTVTVTDHQRPHCCLSLTTFADWSG